jgi:4-amino-4-deoxy-L-arabinose transferase-like glycosyltransferase
MSRLAAQLRQDKPMVFILLAFLLLSFSYSIINPLHEATDELRHYRFVRYLVENGRLPVQGEEACRSQSHHPPLFYALGALATAWIEADHPLCYTPPANPFWAYRYGDVGVDNKAQYLHGADEAFPWRGDALAAHIVRGVNVLIGAVVVWLTWATGRVLWPEERWLARGAAAFLAFNPMFLYMAGAINNDIIAACSGAAITYAGVRLLHDPAGLSRKWGVWLGLAFGFALMSKFNMAAAALLIEVAVSWVAWRNKQGRLWLEVNLLIAGVTFLVAGWWFVRNYLVYGDPTGFQEVTELWGMRDPARSFGVAWSEWSSVWSSLWGRFGFGQIPLPQWVYDGLWGMTLVAAAGLLIELLSPPSSRTTYASRITHHIPILYLILTVLLFAAVVFAYMLVSPAGSMGRFFFPGLPAFTLLLMFGLSRAAAFLTTLLKRVNRKTESLVTGHWSLLTAHCSLLTTHFFPRPASGFDFWLWERLALHFFQPGFYHIEPAQVGFQVHDGLVEQ